MSTLQRFGMKTHVPEKCAVNGLQFPSESLRILRMSLDASALPRDDAE